MRMLAFENDLTLQEVFRAFSQLCLNRNTTVVNMFKKIAKAKRNDQIDSYLNPTEKEKLKDLNALYDYLESDTESEEK